MTDKLFDPEKFAKLDNPEREPVRQAVLQNLNINPSDTVADIGAGTGFFAIPIAQALENGSVFAVDVQPEMLEILRQRVKSAGVADKLVIVQGGAEGTNLPDRSANLILLVNVWHEVENHQAALREFRRIGKQDARLVIVDWRTDAPQEPGPPAHHRISSDETCRILEETGIHPLKCCAINESVYYVEASL